MNSALTFIDFSSAFDSIVHQILINKLEKMQGVTQETLNQLKWYLNFIKLKTGNHTIHQNVGSPQGGIVSPYLWLIYIDDLLQELTHLLGKKNVFASNMRLASKMIRTVKEWSRKFK